MKRQITLISALALLTMSSLKAQQSIGLQSGNFSTPYSAFINPANTYSSKSRIYLNMYSPTMGYTTNGFSYNFPVNPFRLNNRNFTSSQKNSNGNLDFSNEFLKLKDVDDAKGYLLNENYGPSIFFRTDRSNGFGFGIKSVAGASFQGINATTAKLMRYGTDTAGKAFAGTNALEKDKWYSNDKFGIDALSYQEWFLSWAHAAKDQNNSFWKVGVTLKGIVANGHAGLHADNIDYRVNSNNELELRNTDLSLTHTSDKTASKFMQEPFGMNFSEATGGGAGLDIGFMYENRPNSKRKTINSKNRMDCNDEEANNYSWKFGASLTDLGFIALNGSKNSLSTDNNTASWNYNSTLIDQNAYAQTAYDRFARVDQGFMQQLGATAKSDYSVFTPAAINAQLDINLNKGYFVGANWTQNLLSKSARGLKRNSYLAITPRYESESFEVGLPLSLNQDYGKFNVGAYARFGPLVIGSDNLAGFGKVISNTEHSNGNFYFATRFKIKTCGTEKRKYNPITRRDLDTASVDSTFWSDTIRTKDSTIIIKRDTVYKVIRDTIYKQKSETGEDLRKERELEKKEQDLLRREKDLRDRESEVTKRESKVGTGGDGGNGDKCCADLIVVRNDRDRLRRENTLLKDKVSRYKREISDYKRRIVNLESDVNTYRKLADACSDKKYESEKEIKRLKEEIIRCKMSTGTDCEEQTKTLDSLLKIEIEKKKALEAEIIKLKRDKANSDYELKKSKGEYDILKKKNDDLVSKWGEFGKCCEDYSKATGEISRLKNQISELSNAQARIVTLEKEIASLKLKLSAEMNKDKGSDCSSEKAKVIALEKEIANLKRKLTEEISKDKGSDCSVEKAKIVSLEKELAKIKTLLNSEISKNKSLNSKLEECEKKAGSSSEAEILKLKKVISDRDASIKTKDAEISNLKSSIATKDARIKTLESELATCKAKESQGCTKCEEDLRQAKMDLQSSKNAKNALQEEYNYLLKDRDNWKDKFNKCEKDLEAGSGTGSAKVAELEKKITELNRRIATLNSEASRKDASLKALQDSYDKLDGNKKIVDAENARLKAEVIALKASLAAVTAERNSLQVKLKQCETNEGGSANPTGRVQSNKKTVGSILGAIFSGAIEGMGKIESKSPGVEIPSQTKPKVNKPVVIKPQSSTQGNVSTPKVDKPNPQIKVIGH